MLILCDGALAERCGLENHVTFFGPELVLFQGSDD